MNVQQIPLGKIKPYENNPRKNEKAVGPVAESIRQFGFNQPIILDRESVIIAGHTRYKAAKKLGLKTVPCIYADDLTEEQVRAFRLADNKVAEAAFDNEILSQELADLDAIDMAAFGFIPDIMAEDETKEAQETAAGIFRCVVTNEQKKIIDEALDHFQNAPKEILGNQNKQGNKLYLLVKAWAESRDK